MKKTLLVIAIALIVTALVGVAVCAASTGEPTYSPDTVVAVNGVELTIEDTKAGKLQAVIDDCIAGGVIEILADFSAPSISLGANADGDAAKWVINGNGHTVTDSDDTSRGPDSNERFFLEIADSIVVVNDLTIKTYASGIRALKTYANITLNNVNVYAGGTKPGTEITYLPTDSTNRKRYTFALYFRGAEVSYYDELVDNISVRINGGEYKAIGSDGSVMYIRGASVVVTDGTFVGEDMTYVAWVYNYANASAGTKDIKNATSSLSVHDGLFIRPVAGGGAVGTSNPDAALGSVIRLTHGGLFNAYGGTYVNCDGTVPADGSSAPKSSVISCGTGSTAGVMYIYGGEFYQLSEAGSTKGEIIDHLSGTTASLSDPSTMIDLTRATILGGKFYVRAGLPNSNLDAIVAAKADSSITSNDNTTIQRADWSSFAVSRTDGTVTRTVYGKEYTDLNEISFSYTGTQGSNKLKIVTEGRTYYTSDYNVAFNSMAGDGSTVYLVASISTSAKIKLLARNINLNIYGIGSTYEFHFSTHTDPWQGFWFRAGNIRFDGKIKLKTTSTPSSAVIYMGLPDSEVVRPVSVNVTLGDARFRYSKNNVFKNIGVGEGSFKASGAKVDNYGTAYNYSESYTLPTPKPDFTVKTNLTLYSDLIVNFYVPKDASDAQSFTIEGVTYEAKDAPIIDIDGVSYYKFSHTRLAAADALAPISFACTYKSEGGYFDYSASSSYSIVKYASNIQNKETATSSKELVSAVVAYISAAYNYFGSDIATASDLALAESYLASYPVSIPDSIPDTQGTSASALASVISAVTFGTDDSGIRLMLKISDKSKPITVSVGDSRILSLGANHGLSIVSADIRAYDLTKVITITAGDLVGTYSFARYYTDATALNSSAQLKTLLLTMQAYSSKALAYRNYLNPESSVINIVYPASDAHAKEMAELAQRYILAKRGEEYAVVADTEPESACEILIGKTSRAASSVSCPEGSFALSYNGAKMVAYGENDFYLDMAVLYMLENLVDKSATSPLFNVSSGYALTEEQEYSFSGYAQYTDIVSDTLTYKNVVKYSSSTLYASPGITGYTYGIGVSGFNAVYGDQTAASAITSIDSLFYTDLGKYVTMTVNGGSVMTLRFDKQLATAEARVESYGVFVGKLTVDGKSYAYTLTMENGTATLASEANAYTFGYAPDGSSTSLTTGELKNVQGAATDGTYVYFYITNSNRHGAVGSSEANYGLVWKINAKTGSVIKRGEVISLGHGNDMCYDPVSGKLLVAWGQIDYSLVTVVDPDTLEAEAVIDLGGKSTTNADGSWASGCSFFGLTYSEKLDRFLGVTGSSALTETGNAFWIIEWDRVSYEGEFDGVISLPTVSYTKQGIDCDSEYIYYTFSTGSGANSKAYIRTFDYEGNLIRTFFVPYPDSSTNSIEIESCYFVDGVLYGAFNRGGTAAHVKLAVNYNY